MKTTYFFILIFCIFTIFSGFTFADTIELAYVGVDAGGQESISLNGTAMSGANGVMAMNTKNAVGLLAGLISTPNAWAYCYELGAYTDFPHYTYTVQPLAQAMDSGKAALIAQLWAQHYQTAWQASTYIYRGGSYGGFAPGEPANTTENQQALAMNFAIYEIFYDFNGTLASLNLNANSFIAKTSGTNPVEAVNIAGQWLSSLLLPQDYTGPQAQLLALTNSSLQDVIVEVPEPATMILLALGSLALRPIKRHA